MSYHPNKNPAALPAVRVVADLDQLPWGGNAWWDLPIMRHVNLTVVDEKLPRELRKQIAARAGFLMTGEDCGFGSEAEFDEYLAEVKTA